jgi:hypothetical protein|eukprot:scaffold1812_cov181-Alexandrium_tamarense.AAC.5
MFAAPTERTATRENTHHTGQADYQARLGIAWPLCPLLCRRSFVKPSCVCWWMKVKSEMAVKSISYLFSTLSYFVNGLTFFHTIYEKLTFGLTGARKHPPHGRKPRGDTSATLNSKH